jgi:hypothetical protein
MTKPLKYFLYLVVAFALAGYLTCVLTISWAMRQPPEQFGQVMKHVPWPAFLVMPFETMWTRARAGMLQPGDAAPDFRLQTVDHQQQVQLSELRGKPVVLVFGSYT